MRRRVGGTGGVIVIDNEGNIGKHFNTERMAWASLKDGKLYYGLNPGEEIQQLYKR
jgi:isoaspartyl peptidase/L-asparaginase-like protein (Ntn-hydrolase superfamily)